MKTTSTIIAGILAVTQAFWMSPFAQAQPSGNRQHDQAHQRTEKNPNNNRARVKPEHAQKAPQQEHKQKEHGYDGPVPIGGYFRDHHREAARAFYDRQENRGYCPPGLAKKGNNCQPPGQAKKWKRGYPLPRGVVYYDVPRSVVLSLGAPPSGYKYVRVASDILLIALGTSMVVDAIEDMVR